MIANLWPGNSYYHRPITPTGIPFGCPKLWKTHLDEGTFYFWMSKTLMHPASPVRSISPFFNSTPDTCCNPLDKLEQQLCPIFDRSVLPPPRYHALLSHALSGFGARCTESRLKFTPQGTPYFSSAQALLPDFGRWMKWRHLGGPAIHINGHHGEIT